MEAKFSVRLLAALSEAQVVSVALRAAEELDVSILKLTRLLEKGEGMLTKPIGEQAALRVANALEHAGAEVEVVPVSWEAFLLFEQAAQRRSASPDVLASGEWPPLIVQEPARLSVSHPEPSRRRAKPTRGRTPLLLGLLLALLGLAAAYVFLPDLLPEALPQPGRVLVAERPAERSAAARTAFEQQDYDLALELWEPLARAGQAEAQYGLAQLYGSGLGVSPDLERAANWYERAAEQGYARAQYELGWLYANGLGRERDLERAVRWYQRAAEQGFAEAQYQLGFYQFYGQGVPPDPEAARNWFQAAAEQGIAEAQYRLGLQYLEGQGVPRDLERAERWLRQASRQGLREAIPYLAAIENARASSLLEGASTAQGALPEATAAPRAAALPEEALNDDIFALAREGSPEQLIRAVVSGAEVNARDPYGQTPLMYAASANAPEALRELLSGGAQVNAQSEAGWSALMYAARDNPEAIGALLEAGADPALVNSDGQTARDLLEQHHPELLELLPGS